MAKIEYLKSNQDDSIIFPVTHVRAVKNSNGDLLEEILEDKQNTIQDLSDIRSGASAGATAYQKPITGIPLEDLNESVQQAIEAASSSVIEETDPTVPAWAKQQNKPTYTLAELNGDEYHRTVTDLEKQEWSGKLDAFVSGENIKTIDGESVLGSGNLQTNAIKSTEQSLTEEQKEQARENIDVPSLSDLSTTNSRVENLSSVAITLSNKVDLLSTDEIIVAWNGSSAPTVSEIPDGIDVTYNSTTYTGTLTASANTLGKIYLVGNESNSLMDRYITSTDGSTYSWVSLGSTELNLNGYIKESDLVWLTENEFNALVVKNPDKIYIVYEEEITV